MYMIKYENESLHISTFFLRRKKALTENSIAENDFSFPRN
jgi:hypothetical protein